MSEMEPRRSVRATKGQHKSLDLEIEPPKKRGKKSKKQTAEPEEPEEEIIRCVCGATDQDEGSGAWIACDSCGAWQHNICMDLSEFSEDLPKEYWCEQCKPENHKELLAAMSRGEKPWEERRKALEEEKASKKKKGAKGRKGKRQSDHKDDASSQQAKSSPAPPASSATPGPSSQPVAAPPSALATVTPAPKPATPAPQPAPEIKKETKSTAGTKRKGRDEHHEKDVKQPSQKIRKVSETQAVATSPASASAEAVPLVPTPAPIAKPLPSPTGPAVQQASTPAARVATAPVPAPTKPAATSGSEASATKPRKSAAASQKAAVAAAAAQHAVPAAQQATTGGHPGKIADLPDSTRQGAAKALSKALASTIAQAEKKGIFAPTDGISPADRAERFALEIERAVHETHAATAYNSQCRTLSFNLKNNAELCPKLLKGTLTPAMLASMTTEELASRELQKETAEMKARAEKQAIKITEPGPLIRRTHKGDEVIMEDNFVTPSEEAPAPSIRRSSIRDQTEQMSPTTATGPSTTQFPTQTATTASQAKDLRLETKQSPNQTDFDINKVFSTVKSPVAPAIRRPSVPAPPPPGPGVDADVDRMLQDDDSFMYSPTEERDPKVVWRGMLSMNTVAELPVTAKWIAGANMAEGLPPVNWDKLMPKKLTVCGRLDQQAAVEYLCGLRYSTPTDIVVFHLEPVFDAHRVELMKLYNYFSSKHRYGVIQEKALEGVRDTYLIPCLPGGYEAQPEFMQNLTDNIIPIPRTEPMLLGALVFRSDDDLIRKMYNIPPGGDSVPNSADPAAAARVSPTSPREQYAPGYGSVQGTPTPATRNGQQHAHYPHPAPPVAQLVPSEALAREVLGSFFDCKTATFLKPQWDTITRPQLEVIRRIYDRDPKAREDLNHLSQEIKAEGDKAARGDHMMTPTAAAPAGSPTTTGRPQAKHQSPVPPPAHHFSHPHQPVQAQPPLQPPQHHHSSPPASHHIPPMRQTPIPPPSIPPNALGPLRQTPVPVPVIPAHTQTHGAAGGAQSS